MDMVTSPKASPQASPKAAFKMSPLPSIKPTAIKTPPHKPKLSLKKTPQRKSLTAKIDTTPVKSAPPDPPKPGPEGDVDMIEIVEEKR